MSNQISIAERYRAEGREAGYWSGSQISFVQIDEAHQRGIEDGRAEAPHRRTWFALGFLSGLILAAAAWL